MWLLPLLAKFPVTVISPVGVLFFGVLLAWPVAIGMVMRMILPVAIGMTVLWGRPVAIGMPVSVGRPVAIGITVILGSPVAIGMPSLRERIQNAIAAAEEREAVREGLREGLREEPEEIVREEMGEGMREGVSVGSRPTLRRRVERAQAQQNGFLSKTQIVCL